MPFLSPRLRVNQLQYFERTKLTLFREINTFGYVAFYAICVPSLLINVALHVHSLDFPIGHNQQSFDDIV